MSAEDIFVSLPTADDPNKRFSLQDAIVLLVCEVQDLKTQVGELERWGQLDERIGDGR